MASVYKIYSRGVSDLEKQGQKQALKTFQAAAKRVPAYKDFLKKTGVNPKSVKDFADFQWLQLVTKANYLHKNYQQLILAGYPPFLKDLIDKGAEEGFDWKKLKIGFTPAGEVIGEELRDYFLKRGTAYTDPAKVTSIYGTVDAGIVAYETPLSVLLRRRIYRRNLQENYFGRQVLPTLSQYDPR